jgi:hypothetical protein
LAKVANISKDTTKLSTLSTNPDNNTNAKDKARGQIEADPNTIVSEMTTDAMNVVSTMTDDTEDLLLHLTTTTIDIETGHQGKDSTMNPGMRMRGRESMRENPGKGQSKKKGIEEMKKDILVITLQEDIMTKGGMKMKEGMRKESETLMTTGDTPKWKYNLIEGIGQSTMTEGDLKRIMEGKETDTWTKKDITKKTGMKDHHHLSLISTVAQLERKTEDPVDTNKTVIGTNVRTTKEKDNRKEAEAETKVLINTNLIVKKGKDTKMIQNTEKGKVDNAPQEVIKVPVERKEGESIPDQNHHTKGMKKESTLKEDRIGMINT